MKASGRAGGQAGGRVVALVCDVGGVGGKVVTTRAAAGTVERQARRARRHVGSHRERAKAIGCCVDKITGRSSSETGRGRLIRSRRAEYDSPQYSFASVMIVRQCGDWPGLSGPSVAPCALVHVYEGWMIVRLCQALFPMDATCYPPTAAAAQSQCQSQCPL